MKSFLRLLVVFMILALVSGSMLDYVYANEAGACACCDKQCPGSKSCHETSKACSCRAPIPLKVCLLKHDVLTKIVFSRYPVLTSQFLYSYLSNEDIFHPPKSDLS